MATRSAEKAHRQSLKRRIRNRAVKSATKTAVKVANLAIVAGDLNAARDVVRAAIVSLDKAAQKGVIHANNAARHKSRLLIKYNAAIAVMQSPETESKAATKKAAAPKKAAPAKKAPAKKAPAKKAAKK